MNNAPTYVAVATPVGGMTCSFEEFCRRFPTWVRPFMENGFKDTRLDIIRGYCITLRGEDHRIVKI